MKLESGAVMFDYTNLSKYKEGNRLEAKKAAGGLPNSIWTTYSAFANTNGGVILLGVEENADKTLRIIGADNPDKLISDFWNTANNTQKVSLNILSDKNVHKITVDGKTIVSIEIPRADRTIRPVFLNEKPYNETYRRNGEGDYHCSAEEVEAMFRDKSIKTQDMLVLEKMDYSVFDYETVKRYRNQMKLTRPGHIWSELEDNDFLYRLGAVAYGEDRKLHPTSAGLLMFGNEYEIVKEYPYYFLDYQEQFDISRRWDDRIVSSSGEWSGNIYDFYRKTYNKLSQNIKVPFKVENGLRVEDTPAHKALREALANCLINADYYGQRGIVIRYKPYEIVFENPGRFRIEIEAAMDGIVSDPRNAVLMKMFNLIDVGERSGRGIYEIFTVWRKMGLPAPVISELPGIDRTILTLPADMNYSRNTLVHKGTEFKAQNKAQIKRNNDCALIENLVMEYIVNHPHATQIETAKAVGKSRRSVQDAIAVLKEKGLIMREGARKNGRWVVMDGTGT